MPDGMRRLPCGQAVNSNCQRLKKQPKKGTLIANSPLLCYFL